jgi:ribosomal protein S18 acetylase RimI-like enzyme
MIRDAHRRDILALAKMTVEARNTAYVPLLPEGQREVFYAQNTVDHVEAVLRSKMEDENYVFYVKETEGLLGGYIVANPQTGAIPFIFVNHEEQGTGIGRALFEYLTEVTSSPAYYVVVLKDNVSACRFYRSRGFVKSGVKNKKYLGLERIIMEWTRPSSGRV